MKVFVDGHEIKVFTGAVIADILRLYSSEEYTNVSNGDKAVFDEYENIVNLDGAVFPDAKYFIRGNRWLRKIFLKYW